jgi:4-hydroxybenzoate polyprenyltransferase
MDGLFANTVLSFLYMVTFDLVNQISGVDEDMVNKPWRPIPSGLASVKGCIIRCIIAHLVYAAVGLYYKVYAWCGLWQLVVAGYLNPIRFDAHWFFRNHIFVAFGIVVIFMVPVCLVTGSQYPPEYMIWVLGVSQFLGITFTIQDLHDVAGDKASHRQTLPTMLGLTRARWLILGVNAVIWPIALIFIVAPTCDDGKVLCFNAGVGSIFAFSGAFYATIMYRLAAMASAASHRWTYTLVVWHFAGLSALLFYFVVPHFHWELQ